MRRALAAIASVGALAPAAAACPSCGLGSQFSESLLLVYGAFIAVPFVLAYFVTRYVRRITRES